MADNIQEVQRILAKKQELTKEVRAFSRLTQKRLIFKLKSLNLRQKRAIASDLNEQLEQTIKGTVKKKGGDLERVAFSFARKGIFLEHGVGKGRPVGSSSARKYAKPWLKPVLSDAQRELSDLVADKYADIAEAEIIIRIPGIVFKT